MIIILSVLITLLLVLLVGYVIKNNEVVLYDVMIGLGILIIVISTYLLVYSGMMAIIGG